MARRSALLALALETVCTLPAASALVSALAMLRRRDEVLTRRTAFALRLVAGLLFSVSLAYLLHAFDGVHVVASGIKWRETMPLDDFLRLGLGALMGGHTALTWRLLLRAAATFGLLSAGYFVLLTQVISTRADRPALA